MTLVYYTFGDAKDEYQDLFFNGDIKKHNKV
jgi:hypothetical protein